MSERGGWDFVKISVMPGGSDFVKIYHRLLTWPPWHHRNFNEIWTTLASGKFSQNKVHLGITEIFSKPCQDHSGIREILTKSQPTWHQGNFYEIWITPALRKFSWNQDRPCLTDIFRKSLPPWHHRNFSGNLNHFGITEIFLKSEPSRHQPGNFHEILATSASGKLSWNLEHSSKQSHMKTCTCTAQ